MQIFQVLAKGTLQKSSVVSGAQSTDHQFSIYVSPTFAVQLAPEAKVVVWYITENGEMIADSVSVSVRDSFANRVNFITLIRLMSCFCYEVSTTTTISRILAQEGSDLDLGGVTKSLMPAYHS